MEPGGGLQLLRIDKIEKGHQDAGEDQGEEAALPGHPPNLTLTRAEGEA